MASTGEASEGESARLSAAHEGQGDSIRRVRLNKERGVGECGNRPRYGGVRGQQYSTVVANDGATSLPTSKCFDDHGRFRGQQWCEDPAVEMGTAEDGHRKRLVYFRSTSSAGDELVEQDRA